MLELQGYNHRVWNYQYCYRLVHSGSTDSSSVGTPNGKENKMELAWIVLLGWTVSGYSGTTVMRSNHYSVCIVSIIRLLYAKNTNTVDPSCKLNEPSLQNLWKPT